MSEQTTSNTHGLDVVQKWFHAVITHPDGVDAGVESEEAQRVIRMDRTELERIVTRSQKLSAAERIGVYANAYYARLIECLSESFPMLRRAVGGDDVFNGFAFDYLQQHPSTNYTLDRLADNFPRFLAQTRPDLDADGNPPSEPNWPDFLIDLATLELAIGEVFDGPGIEGRTTLDAESVRSIPADRWPQARLVTAPCLRLLKFGHPVNEWFAVARSAADDTELVPPDPAVEYVALTRRDYIVRRIPLTETQYVLLDALQRGRSVGDAIAATTAATDETDGSLARRLMQWFSDWTVAQLFESVDLPQ